MGYFYYFKNDGRCKFIKKILSEHPDKYLRKSVIRDNNGIDYYINLEWSGSKDAGISSDYLDQNNLRYIHTLNDLPEGAGIYISTYDGDLIKIEELKKNNIPFVYKGICPWAVAYKKQLLKVPDYYQCVLLIDETHLLLKNYLSIIPDKSIIVSDKNYEKNIKEQYLNKPLYFIPYATFRKKDFERIVDYITINFPDQNNIFINKTLCGWVTHQGLFEEIHDKLEAGQLDEIWIICSDDKNRSARSLINEIREYRINTIPISAIDDIPQKIDKNKKIGILVAPVPFSKEKIILNEIKKIYDKDL